MKVLLTGGSGNLGHILVPRLLDRGDIPVILDVRAPRDLKKGALFIEGSILDRATLTETFRGCDGIVHIAAWHGIHEDRGEKNAYDFFDLNVRGTFEVFEAAASADLDHWDADGPGSTFRKYYPEYYDLALSYRLDPALKPTRLDISETVRWLGYKPSYSLANLLSELAAYGDNGPPQPVET